MLRVFHSLNNYLEASVVAGFLRRLMDWFYGIADEPQTQKESMSRSQCPSRVVTPKFTKEADEESLESVLQRIREAEGRGVQAVRPYARSTGKHC